MARNGLLCADVPLRNYSLTHSLTPFITGTVLPALGVGALSYVASTGVQKLMGNGLYIKKGGCVCEVETDGKCEKLII